jgi:glutathione S-transferase
MKLYRFPHSPYARKLEALLDLLGLAGAYTLVDVPYCDRSELVAVTGGYLHVPVLVDDDGTVVVESRRIAERLLARAGADGAALVPSPGEGPIWAYCDWVDGPLEDVLFRLASPAVRDRWPKAVDRAMYVLIKERKFGAGCVDAWERARPELLARGRELLAPTASTLAAQPFLFGARPTLADATLYGQFAMLSAAEAIPPAALGASFPAWLERLAHERRARPPKGR